jgi:hypothetical protein
MLRGICGGLWGWSALHPLGIGTAKLDDHGVISWIDIVGFILFKLGYLARQISVMVPTNIEDDLATGERQRDLPDIDMGEAEGDKHNETGS